MKYMIVTLCLASLISAAGALAQTPTQLEDQVKAIDAKLLADEAVRRGDPRRGALVFYTSAAGCVKCHASGSNKSPLGPDLATLGADATAQHLVESLLYPSRVIHKGYETTTVLTTEGKVISGLVVEDRDDQLILRDAAALEEDVIIRKKDIEQRTTSKTSMMPDGLVSALRGIPQFLDLVSYIAAVAQGGPERARQLKPAPEQLMIRDDIKDLDHAGLLKKMKQPDFEAGQRVYNGLCINCHGADGNTPSLPTARAFGKQKLKFGADPYSMLLTLSRGNGLMVPTSHLSPKERYQVIHYIREKFMKLGNPDYQEITKSYLAGLPRGTNKGDFNPAGERDYGPALASQLGTGADLIEDRPKPWAKNEKETKSKPSLDYRPTTSALTVRLGEHSIAYDLHTMNQAGLWQGGFLDLNQTQHMRGRGEGVARPKGESLQRLTGWQWGHEGTLDYSREGLLPRGQLPAKWMDYHGYHVHGDQVVLQYAIDGREILELPTTLGRTAVVHNLRIGPGQPLVLGAATADRPGLDYHGVLGPGQPRPTADQGSAATSIAVAGHRDGEHVGAFTACAVVGDTQGLSWNVDAKRRLILRIPSATESRLIKIVCCAGSGQDELTDVLDLVSANQVSANQSPAMLDPANLTEGGPLLWPNVLTTTGYLGFEQGAYALDTITIPDATPWNTWFRTSALDFFPDGRMVVATYGGDIWMVSGVDADLMNLKWKRYAAGLYEPFGVKVVNDRVYVTCKDRLTRLHDTNRDGEADYYESFSADTDVSTFFHAFNFDLQTDSKGNFYYAKSGQYTSFALPGAIIKVSPDGKHRETYCTGFRTPNGMGILPNDLLTASDNQGNWIPASKVSLLRPGGFYGYVQTHARDTWAPDGGRIDHTRVAPPQSFDPPIIWMPQHLDNSSGGQVWVDDTRWGPLAGRLLHTSFGKGWLYYLMLQEVDGIHQAAIIKLPHDFSTGIMRGRVNPRDGQVYVTGLDGWNGNGRKGLQDKGVQRVRYTGKPTELVTDCQVDPDGLQLTFNFALDPKTAANPDSYTISQWNYHWRHEYGSDMFHPVTDEPGKEQTRVQSARLGPDGRSVKLKLEAVRPVNQLHLLVNLKTQAGQPFKEEIFWTINRVPMKQ